MRKRDDLMSKAELLAEVRRLRQQRDQDVTDALQQEVDVHQEEVRIQQAELRESQRALEESRDRYAELFNFAPIPIVTLTHNGIILDLNLAAAELLQMEQPKISGMPFRRYVARSDTEAYRDFLARWRRGDTRGAVELRLTPHSDSTSTPVEIRAALLKFPTDGQHIQLAMFDLTERNRTQLESERLTRKEATSRAERQATDRFLAMLSHELRTPLTPILFALSTLEKRVPADSKSTLEMVRRNVEAEARLVDDLLDVTRIAQNHLALNVETVDVHETARAAADVCADELRAGRVNLAYRLEATEHWVRGDPTRLRQVFWNLLRNAVRHTPAGGHVLVYSTDVGPDRVAMMVRDSGVGIARADLERIFEPFEQAGSDRASSVGLGLGLAISKGIVEAHGGRITAHSDGLDHGASFVVELPAAAAAAAAATTTATRDPDEQTVRTATVLLVEDNPDSAEAVAEILRLSGYTVHVAGSVAAGLQEGDKGFDVLVSDLKLPDGNGRDLIRMLHSRGPVRGIAFSGFGRPEDVQLSREAGFAMHLTKPIHPDELLTAIDKLLRL